MGALNTIFILSLAFLAVFAEASFGTFRRVLSVQVDFLPGILVYTSLTSGLTTVACVAVVAGLWFDSLSANPLGMSILPLFLVGFIVQQYRHLILSDQTFAQLVLGFGASALAPALSIVILLSMGAAPLLGWGTLWQWFVMTVIGGLVVPLYFRFFHKVYRTLGYERIPEITFRPDREIARGRR